MFKTLCLSITLVDKGSGLMGHGHLIITNRSGSITIITSMIINKGLEHHHLLSHMFDAQKSLCMTDNSPETQLNTQLSRFQPSFINYIPTCLIDVQPHTISLCCT